MFGKNEKHEKNIDFDIIEKAEEKKDGKKNEEGNNLPILASLTSNSLSLFNPIVSHTTKGTRNVESILKNGVQLKSNPDNLYGGKAFYVAEGGFSVKEKKGNRTITFRLSNKILIVNSLEISLWKINCKKLAVIVQELGYFDAIKYSGRYIKPNGDTAYNLAIIKNPEYLTPTAVYPAPYDKPSAISLPMIRGVQIIGFAGTFYAVFNAVQEVRKSDHPLMETGHQAILFAAAIRGGIIGGSQAIKPCALLGMKFPMAAPYTVPVCIAFGSTLGGIAAVKATDISLKIISVGERGAFEKKLSDTEHTTRKDIPQGNHKNFGLSLKNHKEKNVQEETCSHYDLAMHNIAKCSSLRVIYPLEQHNFLRQQISRENVISPSTTNLLSQVSLFIQMLPALIETPVLSLKQFIKKTGEQFRQLPSMLRQDSMQPRSYRAERTVFGSNPETVIACREAALRGVWQGLKGIVMSIITPPHEAVYSTSKFFYDALLMLGAQTQDITLGIQDSFAVELSLLQHAATCKETITKANQRMNERMVFAEQLLQEFPKMNAPQQTEIISQLLTGMIVPLYSVRAFRTLAFNKQQFGTFTRPTEFHSDFDFRLLTGEQFKKIPTSKVKKELDIFEHNIYEETVLFRIHNNHLEYNILTPKETIITRIIPSTSYPVDTLYEIENLIISKKTADHLANYIINREKLILDWRSEFLKTIRPPEVATWQAVRQGKYDGCSEMRYVITSEGKLLIGTGDDHLALSLGRPVLAAGEVGFEKGKVLSVNNASGGYYPRDVEPQLIRHFFSKAGFPEAGKQYKALSGSDLLDTQRLTVISMPDVSIQCSPYVELTLSSSLLTRQNFSNNKAFQQSNNRDQSETVKKVKNYSHYDLVFQNMDPHYSLTDSSSSTLHQLEQCQSELGRMIPQNCRTDDSSSLENLLKSVERSNASVGRHISSFANRTDLSFFSKEPRQTQYFNGSVTPSFYEVNRDHLFSLYTNVPVMRNSFFSSSDRNRGDYGGDYCPPGSECYGAANNDCHSGNNSKCESSVNYK